MSQNNSVNDSYNPPSVGTEFESMVFEDIETDDLLWLSDTSLEGSINVAHRKINDTSAVNIKTNVSTNIPARQKVFQKT